METKSESQLQLLSGEEIKLRLDKILPMMQERGIDALLVSDNANILYLTGRVYCGYVYIEADGAITYFVKRPSVLRGEAIEHIRKPEDITGILEARGRKPHIVALELDTLSYNMTQRLLKVFDGAEAANASDILRKARAVKTPGELALMEASGVKQTQVYRSIPHLYVEGMSDVELQIEIERALRLQGCLGQFRVNGPDMELFMGNILTGDNADTPSPYDFAMGGAGMDPSLPVGADGTIIKPGHPVMVDVNGNFTGYMTDMTRCYITGDVPEIVQKAHDLSRDICHAIAKAAVAGTKAADLYNIALDMATKADMADYFMGHRYHAGFVGHGIGIAVNEPPVLSPRSRDVLVAGNVIAVEPKFVIPGVGAVGVENTYIVGNESPARCITTAPEEIVSLD